MSVCFVDFQKGLRSLTTQAPQRVLKVSADPKVATKPAVTNPPQADSSARQEPKLALAETKPAQLTKPEASSTVSTKYVPSISPSPFSHY